MIDHGRAGRRLSTRLHGFTTTELMVVIGLIVLIMAILLPALNSVRSQAVMSQSMSNMRQVATFMQTYSKENREYIVPSRFDYSDDEIYRHKGPVCADPGIPADERHQGTWADILWTINKVGAFPEAGPDEAIGHDYRTKAPDYELYKMIGNWKGNPFRSTAANSRNFRSTAYTGGGPGAIGVSNSIVVEEAGMPGYFAANNFFDARPDAAMDAEGNEPPARGRWYTTGQIRSPERAMYLVDSFAGPTIDPIPQPFDTDLTTSTATLEVDFRYGGSCLMMFLDSSVRPETRWIDICDLECHEPNTNAGADPINCNCQNQNYRNRGIRISKLTER